MQNLGAELPQITRQARWAWQATLSQWIDGPNLVPEFGKYLGMAEGKRFRHGYGHIVDNVQLRVATRLAWQFSRILNVTLTERSSVPLIESVSLICSAKRLCTYVEPGRKVYGS